MKKQISQRPEEINKISSGVILYSLLLMGSIFFFLSIFLSFYVNNWIFSTKFSIFIFLLCVGFTILLRLIKKMTKDEPIDNWEEKFDKQFPACDCRNGLPPHFEDRLTNSNWIKQFIQYELQRAKDEILEEIKTL